MVFSRTYIFSFVLIVNLLFSCASSKPHSNEEFKPYTIETTFEKLRKKFPEVQFIEPLDLNQIEIKRNLVYKKKKGSNLKLDIFYPKLYDSLYPTVLLIHGGGWLTGSKENLHPMAEYLAGKNFVTITVNYTLGLQEPYPSAVIDLKDAIKWLRKNASKYKINPKKVAILGGSSGGHLATLVGMTPNSDMYASESNISDSDEVTCIINIDGIVSFIHPEAYQEGKMASIWLSGSKEDTFENWKEASPLEYVTSTSPPILFINSSQPRFHAGRDDMVEKLNNYDIYNETHTIENSPHSFWLVQPWFQTTMNYLVPFLNKTLKNELANP